MQFVRSVFFVLFLSLFSFCCIESAFSGTTRNQEKESNQFVFSQDNELDSALEAALKAATRGPATISLVNQAMLKMPKNYLFIPKNEAAALMKAFGNRTNSNFVGLIFSKDDDLRWFITVNFVESGYLRDGDAKNWNADDLMKSIKDGTNEGNKDRIKNGFSSLEIMGWIEPPRYDASVHKLVWSILAQYKDDSSESVVNYNTYVLGREGYFKLDLITSNSAIEKDKLIAQNILESLNFRNGKRYEDFNEHTDRIAEYGLAALITGVVAKKIGLLAIAGAFFIKAWKFIFVLPLLLRGWIKKLFRSNNKNVDTSK